MGKYYKGYDVNVIGVGFNNERMIEIYKGDQLVWDFHKINSNWVMLKNGVKNKLNVIFNSDNTTGVLANIITSPHKIYAPSGLDSQDVLYTAINTGIYLNKNSTHFAGRAAVFNLDYLNAYYVNDMSYAFYNCNYIKGTKYISGPKVTNMAYTYYNTQKKWNIVVGDNVTNIAYAYYNSGIGWSISGPKVINMSYAYAYSDTNLAKCGNNVIDMSGAYEGCKSSNLTYAACGPLVENMYSAYKEVTAMLVPLCGGNVKNFSYAYYNMINVDNAPCGNNVIDMSYAYYCNRTDTAIGTRYKINNASCGPNVINMSHAYYRRNVSAAACGDKVKDMSYAYYGLFDGTIAVCGPNVINMKSAYYNANHLDKITIGDKVEDMSYAFYNASLGKLNCKSGPNVKNMAHAYSLSGHSEPVIAEIGDNVIDASYAFYKCSIKNFVINQESKVENLAYFAAKSTTSSSANLLRYICTNNVINMAYAYEYKNINIAGNKEAACGLKVKNMYHSYYFTNVEVGNIGPNVINAAQAYAVNSTTPTATGGSSVTARLLSCTNGPNVEDAYCIFKNQSLLQDIPFECFPKAINLSGAFYGCKKLINIINISNFLENGYRVFRDCVIASCYNNIYLPDTLKNAVYMFENCNSITGNIHLPYSLEILPEFNYNRIFNLNHDSSGLNIYLYKDTPTTNYLISKDYYNNIPLPVVNVWGDLNTLFGIGTSPVINKITDTHFNYKNTNIYIIEHEG